jgi:hypothetical protein
MGCKDRDVSLERATRIELVSPGLEGQAYSTDGPHVGLAPCSGFEPLTSPWTGEHSGQLS